MKIPKFHGKTRMTAYLNYRWRSQQDTFIHDEYLVIPHKMNLILFNPFQLLVLWHQKGAKRHFPCLVRRHGNIQIRMTLATVKQMPFL